MSREDPQITGWRYLDRIRYHAKAAGLTDVVAWIDLNWHQIVPFMNAELGDPKPNYDWWKLIDILEEDAYEWQLEDARKEWAEAGGRPGRSWEHDTPELEARWRSYLGAQEWIGYNMQPHGRYFPMIMRFTPGEPDDWHIVGAD